MFVCMCVTSGRREPLSQFRQSQLHMLGSQVTGVSICPLESKRTIEEKANLNFTELYSQPQQTPSCALHIHPPFHCNYDRPHVESRWMISLPFCLSTSEPLILPQFLKKVFHSLSLTSTSMCPLVCCISSSCILAPLFMHTQS